MPKKEKRFDAELQEAFEKKRITKKQLAHHANISPSNVVRIFKGELYPSDRVLFSLCEKLGMPKEKLFLKMLAEKSETEIARDLLLSLQKKNNSVALPFYGEIPNLVSSWPPEKQKDISIDYAFASHGDFIVKLNSDTLPQINMGDFLIIRPVSTMDLLVKGDTIVFYLQDEKYTDLRIMSFIEKRKNSLLFASHQTEPKAIYEKISMHFEEYDHIQFVTTNVIY